MIPLTLPTRTGSELEYISRVIQSGKLQGNGDYTKRCEQWLEKQLSCSQVLLTPSGHAALDLAALVLDVKQGDEIIMPSYTYVSTANAFLLRGASLVFVDIQPETMNLDPEKLQNAITEKTRAVVPVHYAGISCEMDKIQEILHRRHIAIVEDASESLFSKFKGWSLGTIGHIGCISFHESENVTAGGQGGAILINDPILLERARIIKEKGTKHEMSSEVSSQAHAEDGPYTWQDIGANYVLSEIQAAYLWAQLEHSKAIQDHRHQVWEFYWHELVALDLEGSIELPVVPHDCEHNANSFYIKVSGSSERAELISKLKQDGITLAPHCTPLHSACPGKLQRNSLKSKNAATHESERLVRLPLFHAMSFDEAKSVVEHVKEFFESSLMYSLA